MNGFIKVPSNFFRSVYCYSIFSNRLHDSFNVSFLNTYLTQLATGELKK